MATVILSNDNIKVKVPSGMTLREVTQKIGASMEFGCRVGDCATCIAYVEEGMQYLNEINQKEIKALDMLNMDSGKLRLMCQCHVVSEEGEIKISYPVVC